MKLFYLARARIPSRKAHVTHINKMCDALIADDKVESLELIHPLREENFSPDSDLKSYYDLKNSFTYRTIFAVDIPFLKSISIDLWFWIMAITFSIMSLLYLTKHHVVSKDNSIIYSRDRVSTLLLLLFKPVLRKTVYLETHDVPGSFKGPFKQVWKRLDGLVVINEMLKKDLVELGFSPDQIMVAHDAVDLEQFNIKENQEDLRKDFNLPLNQTIVGYTGHLYPRKGRNVLLQLADSLPEYTFVTVGGLENQVSKFLEDKQRMNLENLIIIEHQPHSEIPRYLRAFDILLLPTMDLTRHEEKYTSPMKLFEYMASKRPIVASDLPSIQEVLTHRDNAWLADPGSIDEFVEAIQSLSKSGEISSELAQSAREKVGGYTWEKRARKVVNFVSN